MSRTLHDTFEIRADIPKEFRNFWSTRSLLLSSGVRAEMDKAAAFYARIDDLKLLLHEEENQEETP